MARFEPTRSGRDPLVADRFDVTHLAPATRTGDDERVRGRLSTPALDALERSTFGERHGRRFALLCVNSFHIGSKFGRSRSTFGARRRSEVLERAAHIGDVPQCIQRVERGVRSHLAVGVLGAQQELLAQFVDR